MSETTTVSVRNIPVELWKELRLEAIKSKKSMPDVLVEAIKLRLGKGNSK